MERAEQEVVARRARRVVWAFRSLPYGGTAIGQTCDNGLAWTARWCSFDGKTTRFHVADGTVTGTMGLIETVTWSGGQYLCQSGDVTFSADAR